MSAEIVEGEGTPLQTFTMIEIAQQRTLSTLFRRVETPVAPPKNKRVHRPGVIGMLVQPPTDG